MKEYGVLMLIKPLNLTSFVFFQLVGELLTCPICDKQGFAGVGGSFEYDCIYNPLKSNNESWGQRYYPVPKTEDGGQFQDGEHVNLYDNGHAFLQVEHIFPLHSLLKMLSISIQMLLPLAFSKTLPSTSPTFLGPIPPARPTS